MKNLKCGLVSSEFIGQEIIIEGFVKQIRLLKNLVFIDLYTITGTTQIFFKNKKLKNVFYCLDHQKLNFSDFIENKTIEMLFTNLKYLSLEIPVAIIGIVKKRLAVNLDLVNGDVEVEGHEIEFFQLNHFLNFLKSKSVSENVPFKPEDIKSVFEQTKLEYRYFELRNPIFQDIFKKRSQYNLFIRNYFSKKENFIEVETPILTSPTVEGARSFLVPSYSILGNFFALPQSPQIYKQMLMISGINRYFQIAKCFRAEDLRENRQLEFTQLDIEIAFLKSKHVIIKLIDNFLLNFFKKFDFLNFKNINYDPERPFIIDYYDSLIKYGTDKPDFRFLEQNLIHTFFFPFFNNKDLNNDKLLKNKEHFVLNQPYFDFIFILGNHLFNVLVEQQLFCKEKINTLAWFTIPFKLSINSNLLDDFILTSKQNKNSNFYYIEINRKENKLIFFNQKQKLFVNNFDMFNKNLFQDLLFLENITSSDIDNLTLIFNINDSLNNNFFINLGFLRGVYLKYLIKINKKLNNQIAWGWVINWPTFNYDEKTKKIIFYHHPFTKLLHPLVENKKDQKLFKTLKDTIEINSNRKYFSEIFDIVMNGVEIGGGSLRCHDQLLQEKIFKKLAETENAENSELIKKSFNFFLKALNWAPPHGGIALGLDRFYMLINNLSSIRDTIAFPKTSRGTDLLFKNPLKIKNNILKNEWKIQTINNKDID